VILIRIITLHLFLLIFAVPGGSLFAQFIPGDEHHNVDFLRPQIFAGYTSTSTRNFEDIVGTYKMSSFSLGATVPVYDDVVKSGDSLCARFVIANGRFASLLPQVSLFATRHALYTTTFGASVGVFTNSKNLVVLTLNAGFAEDDKTIQDPQLRLTGSGLGTQRFGDSFRLLFGLSYSYTFDRGLFLPILGSDWKFAEEWRLRLLLPFLLEVQFEDMSSLQFGFVVRANGNRFRFEDENYSTGSANTEYLRISQLQAAFRVSLRIVDNLWVYGEAGVLRNRNFSIWADESSLVSSKIENSGYSSMILRYTIGKLDSWID
jgi:hypothetical protein